jgi:long-chain fatty acid transport protein
MNAKISRSHLAVSCTAVAATFALGATTAHAGGLEYAGQGARGLARAGAVTAKAEDPMVLSYNPAGLAELRGTQLMLDVNLALMDACVEPIGYYGWGTYGGNTPFRIFDPATGEEQVTNLGPPTPGNPGPFPEAEAYYVDPLDTVCLDQNVTPIPQLAWASRLTEDLGIGFGFVFPSVLPSGRWGGENGIIRGDTGELRPAATRYMMLSSTNLGVFPTLGLGYRVFDALRIGFAAEWGVLAINNKTMAVVGGGTSPVNDLMAQTKAQDWFVPAFTASIHVVPTDSIDIVAAFRWQDDVNAEGTQNITTGLFDPNLIPYVNKNLKVSSVKVSMPWKLRAGIRYADRLAPRPTGTGSEESDFASGDTIHDPMQDERWDVELDVEYQMNSRNERQVLTYELGQFLYTRRTNGDLNMTNYPSDPTDPTTKIEKNWQDQVSVRAGGTYNVLPGLFGLSAGAHYENRGVDPARMQIDFWPVQRIGVHGGFTIRVSNAVDLTFAYAHLFQEEIVVAPPSHLPAADIDIARMANGGVPVNIDKTVGVATGFGPVGMNGQTVLENPPVPNADATGAQTQVLQRTAQNKPPYIINSGTYRSNIDVISIGVTTHF